MSASSPRLPEVRRHMAIWAMCSGMLVFFPNNTFALDQSRLVQSQSRLVTFSIKAQPLRSALLEFSKQSGIQLIYVKKKETIRDSKALKGVYTIKQALKLLLDSSGFEYEFSEENTVTVRGIAENRDNNSLSKAGPPESEYAMMEDDKSDIGIEEIISLGSRAKGRSALKTPVPVDIISARSMTATGETETGRILQSLAPSFNFSSSSISDGTDAVKPATLRGLGPDQTLVLINGKRRHTSALVHVNTSVGRGATGVDMNAIPPGAIKRIEVLRDGASAQYGSDAIAGVINIILKDQDSGGDIFSSYGQTYEGDGDTFVAGASYGLKLPNQGSLTLSAEYRDKQHTNRAGLTGCLQFETGGQKACAQGNIALDAREATFDRKNFRIGDSESQQKSLTLNMNLPINENTELYLFGTYSDRNNQSAGFYRRANDPRRTVIELYPDGFLPLINSKIGDYSILAGTRWTIGNGWSVDASATTGANSFQFLIANSLNASFGADSPTSADAGTLKIHQATINIDIAKSYEKANIAFGTEWRYENYQIIAGEPASYESGGQLNRNCPGCDVAPIPYAAGFQVFRGFSPDNAVNESRNNFAVYTDVEVDLSSNFLINVAARYENYSDFGNRINAKLSARYQLSNALALRGSISSGFRAPSMQQKFFNSTSTQFIEIDGVSVAQERGTFRNDSDVAHALDIPELRKETAINYSLGFVATPLDKLTITADYYRIDITDRIAISGSIPISENFPAITAATGATDGQFFTNIADTKTQGIDFVVNYDVPMPIGQKLALSLAANKTETEIKHGSIASHLPGVDGLILFSPQDRSIIEEWQPSSRVNFTLDYRFKQWSLILRNNFYGSYVVCEGACNIASGDGQNIQKFSAKTLTDIQVSYNFKKIQLRIMAGANNLFNIFPDVNKIGQSRAGSIDGIVTSPGVFIYSRRSAPFGHNGGYYYLRVAKKF
ncbi:MAG: TonB-dependent receptor [Emcibacter sp.]|nr:TonB-dependent receptor [Emcibacter sp.]